jgi:hypothetical protein
VFGGEGYQLDDGGEGPSPCVYVLDVDTLTWQRCITHAPVEEHSPGARSLHVTAVCPHLLPFCPASYPSRGLQPGMPCSLLGRGFITTSVAHLVGPGCGSDAWQTLVTRRCGKAR